VLTKPFAFLESEFTSDNPFYLNQKRRKFQLKFA